MLEKRLEQLQKQLETIQKQIAQYQNDSNEYAQNILKELSQKASGLISQMAEVSASLAEIEKNKK
ncbi:hypothetical protein H0N94_01115 [Campylobacter fetus subsp. fetus]|nr:hypothetical protein [Campylobacter fetus]MBC3780014.1 hypothetical protein [Campylobacter fetus subsp. fetus]MBC3782876.1 hypothetical protein [Campylobacter fetus subsp. venerealis]